MSIAVKVASLADLPENAVSVVEHAGQRIAIYRVGGSIYATTDICSHEYAELSQGYLDTDDCTIECPLHGSRFDLRTGAVLSLPAYEPIAVYPVRVEGEDVLVELPE
jgi:3-phenylpropionate/trans-cinnamate dioxygenase ferredoxin subunit